MFVPDYSVFRTTAVSEVAYTFTHALIRHFEHPLPLQNQTLGDPIYCAADDWIRLYF